MADRQPQRGESPRGFTIYDEFDDQRGSKVRVQKSSLATDDCLWIFTQDQLATEDRPAHVNVDQAAWLRDALTAFIDEHRA